MKNHSTSKKMNWAGVVAGGGVILGLLALATIIPVSSTSASSQGDPKVIDRDSVVYGRTYSEWSAAWEQWADSIPVANHPLFDNGDCSVGQSGPVWFLGGKFCAYGAPCGTNQVVRNCSVPAGKALYFPVLDVEDSALEENLAENPGNETLQQIAGLRAFAASVMDNTTDLSCDVDGASIPHLGNRFRIQSTAFGFTLPADNLFAAIYGNRNFVAGSYFPAVEDGVDVMLAPLHAGQHVIHFHGSFTSFPFTLDVTYYVAVAK